MRSFSSYGYCWGYRNSGKTYYFRDVILSAMASHNIKAPRHWPLWGEFTGEFPQKGPVMRKMFPFNDVIMFPQLYSTYYGWHANRSHMFIPSISTNYLRFTNGCFTHWSSVNLSRLPSISNAVPQHIVAMWYGRHFANEADKFSYLKRSS